jgi:lipopolysaccharide cholinephosphotransferase
MEYSSEKLRKLQLVQLLSLLEIKRICDKHNIHYTPIGGTLLGTVRHKGFIPWDDDIDVGMLREEYNKFLEVAKNELRPEFFLQTYETDPNYPKALARLCVNETTYMLKWEKDADIHHGAFTDIFPYDNSPDHKLGQIYHKYMIKWLHHATYHKYSPYGKPTSIKGKIFLSTVSLPFTLNSKKSVRKLWDKIMQKYNSIPTEYVVRTGSQYPYAKVRLKRVLMEEFVEMDFEGFNISVMKGYHEHLSENYGDYMELPPIEKRRNVQTSCVKLDLGPYEDSAYLEQILSKYKKEFEVIN